MYTDFLISEGDINTLLCSQMNAVRGRRSYFHELKGFGGFSPQIIYFFSQRGQSNISQALSGPNEGVWRGSVRRWVYVSWTFFFLPVCAFGSRRCSDLVFQICAVISQHVSLVTQTWLTDPPIHWTWRKGDHEAPESCDVKEAGVICLGEGFGNVLPSGYLVLYQKALIKTKN